VDFNRKENFRSSFKEDRKSNEAPKMCRKQGEAAYDRAPGSTTVLQWQQPRTAVRPTVHRRTAGRASWHGRAICLAARDLFFSPTYLSSLHF